MSCWQCEAQHTELVQALLDGESYRRERNQLRAALMAITEPDRAVVIGHGETLTITVTFTAAQWRNIVALLEADKETT
jgi:hypothetical protein